MFFIEIIMFYLLHVVSAPAWCYVLNAFAVFVSLFHGASALCTFIYETNGDMESEMEDTVEEAVGK